MWSQGAAPHRVLTIRQQFETTITMTTATLSKATTNTAINSDIKSNTSINNMSTPLYNSSNDP